MIQSFISNTGFLRSKKGKFCQKCWTAILKQFPVPVWPSLDHAVISRNNCENYCRATTACWGCSVAGLQYSQWNAITECGAVIDWAGVMEGDITQKKGIY